MIYKHFQFTKLEQVFWQYKIGGLFRYEMVEVLRDWDYSEPNPLPDDRNGTWDYGPNTFCEVIEAYQEGLIDQDAYDEIFWMRHRSSMDRGGEQ